MTVVGGKEKNKHSSKRLNGGRGTVGRVAAAGVKDRATNKVSTAVVERTGKPTLQGFVESRTQATATVYTGEASAYAGIPRDHGVVKRSVKEYVNGMCHTNG